MNIGELIVELQKFDPSVPVCGESEVSTWDMEPKDLVVYEDVEHRPVAMILGYCHGIYDEIVRKADEKAAPIP